MSDNMLDFIQPILFLEKLRKVPQKCQNQNF